MSSPFESYDDLEDADERLKAADPAERRVAIIALGRIGGTASINRLTNPALDPTSRMPEFKVCAVRIEPHSVRQGAKSA